MQGRRAIVTGAGRGIGQAIAVALARRGADVAVLDLTVDSTVGTVNEIKALGRRVIGIAADVSDSAAVSRAVAEVVEAFGGIDILVNNAGWTNVEPFMQSTEATWDKIIAINLKGPLIMCKAVLERMIPNGYGRIVNIGSDAGRVGSSGEAVYSGAKGGLIAFSKALAREVARHNITVNVVCPGPTDTPLMREHAQSHPKLMESILKLTPLRKFAKPEDIAAAVTFLASDEAGHITGQTLSVSGGLTMV